MDEQEINNFRNEISATTEQLEDFHKALKILSPALIKLADPTNKFSDELNKAARTTQEKRKADKEGAETTEKQTKVTKQNIHVTEALTEAQEELEESSNALKSAMGSAASGMTQSAAKFMDALTSGKEGFDKYGGAVRSMGDAALDVGKQFGVLGTIIGALIKGMSIVVEKQLKLIDSSLKATDGVNKLSGGIGFTTEKLQQMTWATGRTMEQFDKILKPMQSASKALVSLGGDASKGAEAFINFTKVGMDNQNKFRKLGVSYDELTQYQADYLALQRMSGRTYSDQYVTSGKLQKASLEYVMNLQELKVLTGEDIDTLKKRQEEANSTAQMAIIANMQLNKRLKLEKDLEDAQRSGDKTRADALNKQLDQIKNQEQAMKDANNAMVRLGRTDLSGALQSFLQTGTMSESLAKQFTALGMDLNKYKQQYDKGQFQQGEFMNEYLKKQNERMGALGESALMAGDNINQFAQETGLNVKNTGILNDTLQKGIDHTKQQQEVRAALDAKANSTDDKYQEARNKTIEAEQKAATNTEKALASNIDATLKAMPELATQAARVTEYFQHLADALKVILTATGIYGLAKGAKAAAGAFKSAKDWLGKIGKGPTPPAPTPPTTPSTPVGKDGKPLRGAALKSAQEKAAREAAAKAAQAAAAKAAPKAATAAATAAAPAAGAAAKSAGMLSKAAGAVGKFGKFIPGVGWVLAGGMAAAEGIQAAGNAEEVLGLQKGQKATTGQKVAAGAAGALSSLTLGLVDQKTIGGFLNKSLGLGETEEDKRKKLEEENKKKAEEEKKKLEEDKKKEAANTAQVLTDEIKKAGDPLSKFGDTLSTTRDPIKAFGDRLTTLNNRLSDITKKPVVPTIDSDKKIKDFDRKVDSVLNTASNPISRFSERIDGLNNDLFDITKIRPTAKSDDKTTDFDQKFEEMRLKILGQQNAITEKLSKPKFDEGQGLLDLPQDSLSAMNLNMPNIPLDQLKENQVTYTVNGKPVSRKEYETAMKKVSGILTDTMTGPKLAPNLTARNNQTQQPTLPTTPKNTATQKPPASSTTPMVASSQPTTSTTPQQSAARPTTPNTTTQKPPTPSTTQIVADFGANADKTETNPIDKAPPVQAKSRSTPTGTMTEQDIKDMIIAHEGIRYEPYKDTLGLWTVGVGHLIGDGKTLPPEYNRKFSHEEVMAMFDKDYDKHKKQAQTNVPGFGKYDSVGQAAFIDLTFNMGPGWPRKFKNTSKKIEEGDTFSAARGLENSLWYKQVATRGPTIVGMVENAKVQARQGGIVKGPQSGFPATLHGNEIIVPLDPNSLLAELGKKPAAQAAADMSQKMPDLKVERDNMKEMINLNQTMVEMLASKLDNVITKLDAGVDVQSKILKHTQA